MPLPWSRDLAGRVDEHWVESAALADNPLGDPNRRPLMVYVPPGAGDRPLPVVYAIQGFTGQIDMWRNRNPFGSTYIEDLDILFALGETPPCLVAMVDCWTSLGGSQFVDSPGTGRYHTYLCDEVVPFVDAAYPTLATAAHRGIAGKSSGGYGAMITPMLRPDVFGGLATHAGDALFECCYQPDIPQAVRRLRDVYDGRIENFLEAFRRQPGRLAQADHVVLNAWAMAACYSTDEDGTVHLPFDTATGRLIPEIWERWLAWDPVRMVDRYADALRGLRAIWIDAGSRDDYFLDLGAEAFRAALERIGVTDVHFELFDGTHGGIGWRYPLAIGYLARRLAAG